MKRTAKATERRGNSAISSEFDRLMQDHLRSRSKLVSVTGDVLEQLKRGLGVTQHVTCDVTRQDY